MLVHRQRRIDRIRDRHDGDQTMFRLTQSVPTQLRWRCAMGPAPLTLLAPTSGANAQGLVQGVQQGAQAGNKAAGPVGGVLGGAIGGVVGVFTGVLGTGQRPAPAATPPAANATRQGAGKATKAAKAEAAKADKAS